MNADERRSEWGERFMKRRSCVYHALESSWQVCLDHFHSIGW